MKTLVTSLMAVSLCTALPARVRRLAPADPALQAGAGAVATVSRPEPLATVRRNNFFSAGSAQNGAGAGTATGAARTAAPKLAPAGQSALPALPLGSVLRPPAQSPQHSPARTTAASLRPQPLAKVKVPLLNLGGLSRLSTLAEPARHRRSQAWGGAGAGAATLAARPSTWSVIPVLDGKGSPRSLDGAVLRQVFEICNPTGDTLVLYNATPDNEITRQEEMTTYVFSSQHPGRRFDLCQQRTMDYLIKPGESISVHIAQPTAPLLFKLLDQAAKPLQGMEVVPGEDAEAAPQVTIGACKN